MPEAGHASSSVLGVGRGPPELSPRRASPWGCQHATAGRRLRACPAPATADNVGTFLLLALRRALPRLLGPFRPGLFPWANCPRWSFRTPTTSPRDAVAQAAAPLRSNAGGESCPLVPAAGRHPAAAAPAPGWCSATGLPFPAWRARPGTAITHTGISLTPNPYSKDKLPFWSIGGGGFALKSREWGNPACTESSLLRGI